MLPTSRSILLILFTAPLIALATWAPLMQWIAGAYLLLIIGICVMDWRLAGNGGQFEITRHHDTKLSLGVENTITLRLNNRSQRPISFSLRDEPPLAFIANLPVNEIPILEGHTPPRSSWQESYQVRPLRRGDYQFGDFNLRWGGPLGFVRRQVRYPATAPVKVYPNLMDVRRYDLLLRRNRLQEMGLRRARVFGEGTEFERLRDYIPDDDFRRIDWKATARRHRPITIEYQTERSQNVIAMVDTGRMMQSPVNHIAKLDYVINTVLLLAFVATGRGDKIGLLTFADDVQHFVVPQKGRSQFNRMLELLYAVEAQPVEPDYRKAMQYLALKHRRRALVAIFTDLSGGMSMQTLVNQAVNLTKRSLPLVVTISDPDVHTAAKRSPQDSKDAYQRFIAIQMLEDRKVALEGLQRQGVLTIDVPAPQLSLAVINRYLELKGKTLL